MKFRCLFFVMIKWDIEVWSYRVLCPPCLGVGEMGRNGFCCVCHVHGYSVVDLCEMPR